MLSCCSFPCVCQCERMAQDENHSKLISKQFSRYRVNAFWWQYIVAASSIHLAPMMTPSNGNIFRVTGPLWGESTGHQWIPLTKASDVELWCFLWSAHKQTVKQTIETPLRSLWPQCYAIPKHREVPPFHFNPERWKTGYICWIVDWSVIKWQCCLRAGLRI